MAENFTLALPGNQQDTIAESTPSSNKSFNLALPGKQDTSITIPDNLTVGDPETLVKSRNKYMSDADRQKAMQEDVAKGVMPPGIASAIRGATVNLSDKAISAGKSLLQKGNLSDYEKNLAEEQAQRDAYQELYPSRAYPAELLGGMATGGKIISGATGAAKGLLPGAAEYAAGVGLGPAMTRAAGAGALASGFGAVSGAGASKPGEELQGAATGAVLGPVVAGAVAGAIKGGAKFIGLISPMAEKVSIMAGVRDPADIASKRLAQTLLEDGYTPETAAITLRNLATVNGSVSDALQNPNVLADIAGPNTKALLKSVSNKEGEAKDYISNILSQRAAEQPDRLLNTITDSISKNNRQIADRDAIVKAGIEKSAPLYDKAKEFGGTPKDLEITDWFNTNKVRQSMLKDLIEKRENIKDPANSIYPMQATVSMNPKTGDLEFSHRPSIADLHELRMELSDAKAGLWNSIENKFQGKTTIGIGKDAKEYDAKTIDGQLKSLTDLIDKHTTDPNVLDPVTGKPISYYQQARKAYSDMSSTREAYDKGLDILKNRPEAVDVEMSKLGSEAEREAYRAAVASKLTDLTNAKEGASLLKSIYGTRGMRQKLEKVIGEDAANQMFSGKLASEQAMQETHKALAPGLKSNDILSATDADWSLPLAATNAMVGRWPSAVANVARYGTGILRGMSGEIASPLARLGMMGPEEAATWANKMNEPGALTKVMNAFKDPAEQMFDYTNPGVKNLAEYLSKNVKSTPYVTGGLAAGEKSKYKKKTD